MAPQIQERIRLIQEALREEHLEGWLMYNFRGSNVFATRILELLPHIIQTRRYFYFIPANGSPKKLVHAIEQYNLDTLPGEKTIYLSWQSLERGLKAILAGVGRVAMEYSPRNAIPYVSSVDGGTLELVRSIGVEVVSSADLVQRFEACWDDEQAKDNAETVRHLRAIVDATFGFIRQRILSADRVNEYDVQQFMLSEFSRHYLDRIHWRDCPGGVQKGLRRRERGSGCGSHVRPAIVCFRYRDLRLSGG
jgi:hypothetical protein